MKKSHPKSMSSATSNSMRSLPSSACDRSLLLYSYMPPLGLSCLPFACECGSRVRDTFSRCPLGLPHPSCSRLCLALHAAMPQLSAEAKHHILLEYAPH